MTWDAEDLPRIEPELAHTCEAGDRLRRETNDEQAVDAKEALWGHAVTRVEFAAGGWWAHNEEYASVVRFCPWCGVDLQAETSA
jgi:hypothetical protein